MPSKRHSPRPVSEPPMYDFSVIRDLRKHSGMSIGTVSGLSGVSPAVISKLERNRTTAELSTLFRLGRVFGVTTQDLIALAESRTAHLARTSSHSSGGFVFKEILYGNVRLLSGEAKKGARVSRPEIHRDDYEVCWVLKGGVRFTLPHETHTLKAGEAIQFDAVLQHTYEAVADCQVIIAHLRKGKRF